MLQAEYFFSYALMKKKLFLFFFSLLSSSTNFAQVATGYYRVQNANTKRYAALYDTKAKVDKLATNADLSAIRTYYYYDRIVSDPASVIYIDSENGNYALKVQGSSTREMMGDYSLIIKKASAIAYTAYGTYNNYSVYLCDEGFDDGKSFSSDADTLAYMATSGNLKYWYINAISSADDTNYFGFKPDLKVGNDYYQSFYASFPFSFASTNTKAYYIDKKSDERGIVELKEFTGQDLPASTPMIIKSNSDNPSDNRVNLLTSSVTAPSDNLLTGVYFCSVPSQFVWYDQIYNHDNYVENNPATMRVLQVQDGALVLKKVDWKYIPRNSFYMSVSTSAPDVYRVLSPEDYLTGIHAVISDSQSEKAGDVYNLSGQKVGDNTDILPHGVYIQNGIKILK